MHCTLFRKGGSVLAFESLPGVKITDHNAEKSYIIADFFSVYTKSEELPLIYKWSDFKSIAETHAAFILTGAGVSFNIPKRLLPDPAVQLRVRAIIEGVVAANPRIEYRYGIRILPPKTFCVGCEVPPDAYIATGSYKEGEINNANVILRNSRFDKLLWFFAPIAAIVAFAALLLRFGNLSTNFATFGIISLFAGAVAGLSVYLLCAYWAKTLYGKILREDQALLEDITFVVCEQGFMAAETFLYDYSDIIPWNKVAYFIETTHVYIVFSNDKAVFWLPRRLFPKELHKELGDFIADRLLQK